MTRALAFIVVACILTHLGCARTTSSEWTGKHAPIAAELARLIDKERLRDDYDYRSVERAREGGVFDDEAIAFFESFAKTAETIDELNQSQTIEWTDDGIEASFRIAGGKGMVQHFAGYFRYLVHQGTERDALRQIENGLWLTENTESHDVDPYLTHSIRVGMRNILTTAVAADALQLSSENFDKATRAILESWEEESSTKEVFDDQLSFLQSTWARELDAANGKMDALSKRGRRLIVLLTGTDTVESAQTVTELARQRMDSVAPIRPVFDVSDYHEGVRGLRTLEDNLGEDFESWTEWARSIYKRNRRTAIRMQMLELARDYVATDDLTSDGDARSAFGIPIQSNKLADGIRFHAHFYPDSDYDVPVTLEVGACASFVATLRMGSIDAVSHWLDAGRGLGERTESGEPPLHVAAAHGRLELVQFLVEKGAPINGTGAPDSPPINGMTEEMAKHYGYGPLDAIAAEPRPLVGETALDAAESNEQSEVAAWLRANGGRTTEELNRERGFFKRSDGLYGRERIQEEEE